MVGKLEAAQEGPESVASPAQQLAALPEHFGVLCGVIRNEFGRLLEVSVPAGDELPAGRDFESLNSTVEAQSALSKHGYWCSRTKQSARQEIRRFFTGYCTFQGEVTRSEARLATVFGRDH